MSESAVTLDQEQRQLVECTILEHCRIRGWQCHAMNCRSNHVHVVVTAPGREPDDVMNQFKAWCTRRLKELARQRVVNESSHNYKPEALAKDADSSPDNPSLAPQACDEENIDKPEAPAKEKIRQNWWTQRGSRRWLNDTSSLESAIRYVLEGQTTGR
jgi:REP element-mobilizing transposase RayT